MEIEAIRNLDVICRQPLRGVVEIAIGTYDYKNCTGRSFLAIGLSLNDDRIKEIIVDEANGKFDHIKSTDLLHRFYAN